MVQLSSFELLTSGMYTSLMAAGKQTYDSYLIIWLYFLINSMGSMILLWITINDLYSGITEDRIAPFRLIVTSLAALIAGILSSLASQPVSTLFM